MLLLLLEDGRVSWEYLSSSFLVDLKSSKRLRDTLRGYSVLAAAEAATEIITTDGTGGTG